MVSVDSLAFFIWLGILPELPAPFLRRGLHSRQLLVHHVGVLAAVAMFRRFMPRKLEVFRIPQQLRRESSAVVMPAEILLLVRSASAAMLFQALGRNRIALP